MAEQKHLDITERVKELDALRPISVTFMGKTREVHFFHRGTAEAFFDALKGTSENESMKRHKQREVRLLAIVLADLHGSGPYFKRLKRWIWRIRLAHSRYSDVEAVALLEAAAGRIQNGKQLDALIAIVESQCAAIIAIMNNPDLVAEAVTGKEPTNERLEKKLDELKTKQESLKYERTR
jgi:hypothetical protein